MGLTANELSLLKGTGGSNPLASAGLIRQPEQLNMKAPVAQRIEHLTTDQKVGGSNPFGRTQVRGAFIVVEAPLLVLDDSVDDLTDGWSGRGDPVFDGSGGRVVGFSSGAMAVERHPK